MSLVVAENISKFVTLCEAVKKGMLNVSASLFLFFYS